LFRSVIPQNGNARAPPLGYKWGMDDPLETRPPHMRYHAKFGRSRSNRMSMRRYEHPKNWDRASRLSRSLKVIGTDNLLSICDFL